MKCKIVSLREGKNERSPRFAALFSTRGEPYRLLLPPSRPPASKAPGEGLHGRLLDGSCGRRRRRGMRDRLNVGTYAPGSEYETLIRRRRFGKKKSIVRKTNDTIMICAVSIIHCLFYKKLKNVSCEYTRLNG